jgi:hypothetical protein
MPTFIKTGYWESAVKSYKGWLNLNDLFIENSGLVSPGQVAFYNSNNSITGSNALFWNNVNGRLGIKSTNPLGNFEVKTTNDFGLVRIYNVDDQSQAIQIYRGNNGGPAVNLFVNNGTISTPTDVSFAGAIARITGNIYLDGAYRTVARMEYTTTAIPAIGNPPTAIRWLTTDNSYSLNEKAAILPNGNFQIGESYNSAPRLSRLYVKSSGSTAATYTAQFQNSTNTSNSLVIDDAGSVMLGTVTSSGERLQVNGTAKVQGGSIASGVRAFVVSATLPDSTGLQFGTYLSATSAGTLGRQFAVNIDLLAGYSGIFATAGFQGSNSAQGTGSQPFNGSEYGNVGANLNSVGVTIGTNYGLRSNATGGNVNYGVFSNTTGAKTSATNIAVAGFSINTGATPINIAGYFGLQNVIPTFTSAALIADNGTTTSPIFIARDNGVNVFSIVDGGNVLATQYNLSALNTAPASAAATGTLGEIRIDANHIYVCTATNTWKRVAIATW